MAATSLAAIRAGLAANLKAAFPNVQCTGYLLLSGTPPLFEVVPAGVVYDQALHGGLDTWTMIVRGVVPATSDQGSQNMLDEWMFSSGSGSVKAAIESDPTLGGAVFNLQVNTASGYTISGATPGSGGTNVSVEWSVELYAQGVVTP